MTNNSVEHDVIIKEYLGPRFYLKKLWPRFKSLAITFWKEGVGMIELIIKKSGVERSRSPSALVPDGKTCGEGSTP